MFWKPNIIHDDKYVTDIVAEDYRTSYVFRKYNMDYCCGGRIPLRLACELHGVETERVKDELHEAMRVIRLSSTIDFANWNVDFLIDYIMNVHHCYLTNNLPIIWDTVEQFTKGHLSKYPYLNDLQNCLSRLRDELGPHIEQENQIIFPYIKQIVHAYENREPYAALLVRTLRKPVEKIMKHEQENIRKYVRQMRELTNHYTAPASACITHKVAFSKLQELDDDLVQHIHLENNILFPKAIAMEKELLATPRY
jgi:regulator of cell morphogenesis and NO signaling